MMLAQPDVGAYGRMRAPRRDRSRRRHGLLLASLAAIALAIALERLIYLQIDDHFAAIMIALIAVMIVVVAVAPGARSGKS